VKKELKELIQKDLSRVYDGPLTIKQRLFLPPQIKYIILWRKASFYQNGNPIAKAYYSLKLLKLSERTGLQIPTQTTIGEGLYIGHHGRIIMNPDVTIGNNVNLATGITIGQCNRGAKKGVPTIGNRVWIGTNAVIVGKITIGDDVLIAPGAYVNQDVPSHSIVIGNPAVIHPAEHATKDYINKTV